MSRSSRFDSILFDVVPLVDIKLCAHLDWYDHITMFICRTVIFYLLFFILLYGMSFNISWNIIFRIYSKISIPIYPISKICKLYNVFFFQNKTFDFKKFYFDCIYCIVNILGVRRIKKIKEYSESKRSMNGTNTLYV